MTWRDELPPGDEPLTIIIGVTLMDSVWRDIHKQVAILRSKQIMDRQRLTDIQVQLTTLEVSLASLHTKIDRLLDDHRLT